MRLRRSIRPLSLLAVAAALLVGTARAQIVTVSTPPVSTLLDHARAVAKTLDAETGQTVLGMLDQFGDPASIPGLDRTKPIVAFGDLPGPVGGPPFVAIYVPVTNKEDFLKTIVNFGVTVDDKPEVAGFTHKITLPNGTTTLFVLDVPGYAVFSTASNLAVRLKTTLPATLRPAKASGILANFRVDQVPDQVKQTVLDSVSQRTAADLVKKPEEPEANFRGRVAGSKLVTDSFAALVKDGRNLNLSIDLTPAGPNPSKVAIGLSVDAQPGTAMAKSLAGFGKLTGKFAGVATAPGAAASYYMTVPVSKEIRDPVIKAMKESRDEAAKKTGDDDMRVINMILEAVEPTLNSEVFDGFLRVAVGPSSKGAKADAMVMMGLAAKRTATMEATFREAVTKLKPDEQKNVTVDADKAADGTAVHKITMPPDTVKGVPIDEEVMHVAFAKDSVLLALGGKGLASIKRALADLKATPKEAPQAAIDVSALSLSKLGDTNVSQTIGTILSGPNATKDHARLRLNGTDGGLELKLEADLPMLRIPLMLGVSGRVQ